MTARMPPITRLDWPSHAPPKPDQPLGSAQDQVPLTNPAPLLTLSAKPKPDTQGQPKPRKSAMRILHTADWHIGQTLSGFSREAEHRAFLDHLGTLIVAHDVDALLVAGDVFDGINPSGEAQRMLYTALASYLRLRPGLTIVMIAGNHDPAARLEAPEAVLRALGVHVVGTMSSDLSRHLIPLSDATGIKAHVLAIPFLRAADLPGLTLEATQGPEGAVVTAVRALHASLTEAAIAAAKGLPLLAMGHLTCLGAEESQGAERPIRIGGEDAVPPSIYPAALCYVALGHLHKPQSLDGGRVRYSGSPFPLSAAEIPYDHGVTLIDLHDPEPHEPDLPVATPSPGDSEQSHHTSVGTGQGGIHQGGSDPGDTGRRDTDQGRTGQSDADTDQGGTGQPTISPRQAAQGARLTHRHIPLPRLVPNLRLPAKGAMLLSDLPTHLTALSLNPDTPRDLQPFVHVTLTADRPASQLKAEAEALLDKHPIRVASLIIDRAIAPLPDTPPPSLSETTPEALFAAAFRQTHSQDPGPAHLAAFRDALAEV